jgi:hypothetical protein
VVPSYKKVLLTKDNLVKRNLRCTFAKLIWHVVYFTFNITAMTNLKNMFCNWLNRRDKKLKHKFQVGVCALL